MKAAYIENSGPPEVIQIGDLPVPKPGAKQALVRVEAVSVNPIDTYIRAGMVKFDLPRPYIIGCDLAGVVEEAGTDLKRFKPGDPVWGSNQGLMGRQGTFAEYAVVDEQWLYRLPDPAGYEDAAAIALVGITAHLGLFRNAQLKAGETIFVHGGSGGVGSMVTQMARFSGARVITTAGSEVKAAQCRRLGANEVILYKQENVEQRLAELAPQGVNVWWETLRQPEFEKAIPRLAPRGRMIVMAGRDAKPPFPVGPFYTRDCSIHGFAMFNASPEEQARCAEDINRWLEEGRLHPNVDRVLPLEEAAAAHTLQEESTVGGKGILSGKIVLKP